MISLKEEKNKQKKTQLTTVPDRTLYIYNNDL